MYITSYPKRKYIYLKVIFIEKYYSTLQLLYVQDNNVQQLNEKITKKE